MNAVISMHIWERRKYITMHKDSNKNGRLLLENAEECGLNITNTIFEKRKGRL